MSSVTKTILCGLCEFMPSNTFCVRFVRRVLVECTGPKACCEGVSGMLGVICVRKSSSDFERSA